MKAKDKIKLNKSIAQVIKESVLLVEKAIELHKLKNTIPKYKEGGLSVQGFYDGREVILRKSDRTDRTEENSEKELKLLNLDRKISNLEREIQAVNQMKELIEKDLI